MNKLYETDHITIGQGEFWDECPNCYSEFLTQGFNYCPICGARILEMLPDWKGAERREDV